MSKAAQHNKVQMRNSGAVVEQKTVIEDSFLPSAEELYKLKEVKPELVDWIMERAAKEQDARHDFNRARVRLANKEMNGTIWINILCILFAFLIIIAGILATLWLLHKEMTVAGTIFASGTIIGAAALFMRIPKNTKNNK